MTRPVSVALRKELIELGRAITEDQPTPDEAVSMVERYVALFEKWQRSDGVAEATPSELKSLQGIHSRVLSFVGRFKERTARELKAVKRRGKGMLAYVDTLPKRISTTKTLKG